MRTALGASLLVLACGALAACTSANGDDRSVAGAVEPTLPGAADGPSAPAASVAGHPSPAISGRTPPPCGAAQAEKCALGRTCTDGQDCSSGVCQTAGPWKNRCVRARSCDGERGANDTCEGNVDCCTTITVPGGSFTNYEGTSTTSHAVVSRFQLDKYEITVGRLRAFFRAMDGSPRSRPPAAGAAEHPLVPGTGWRSSWNVRLPGSWAEVDARMTTECAVGGDNAAWGAATWTTSPGPNEDKPANCIDWYTLFAFCAWDGGRLPTDAEWSYVALSGAEQRAYPWGNAPPAFESHRDVVATAFLAPGATYGRYTEGTELRGIADGPLHISSAGKKSARSAWGHADLAGNVIEFVVDVAKPIPASCNNCVAGTEYPDPPQGPPVQPLHWQSAGDDDLSAARAAQDGMRIARGGSWQGAFEGHALDNAKNRHWYPVWRTYSALGGRCARNAP